MICLPWLALTLLAAGAGPRLETAEAAAVAEITEIAEVHVAVAANFAAPLDELARAFAKGSGRRVVASSGSSGKLYAQIKSGAPFEVLLSADSERPALLEREGAAVAGSRFTYALGKLVLWSRDPGLVDPQGKVLVSGRFQHLAIANPEIAPYGTAARQVLQSLGLWERLSPRLVLGEDIGQTYQFAATGNAELAFVALSQLRAAGRREGPPPGREAQPAATPVTGSFWLVPATRYQAIAQQAVLLARGKDKPAARAFLDFLRGPEARRLIEGFGYGVP
ncbi:MAG TPA: molybdate ABC transporter substrate-binding protein [Thermoanaerobaculia bacterium]|nr:molybdate ABC transporter substrate-binding protein [Thermoanaerobaculia bacterium]